MGKTRHNNIVTWTQLLAILRCNKFIIKFSFVYPSDVVEGRVRFLASALLPLVLVFHREAFQFSSSRPAEWTNYSFCFIEDSFLKKF